MEIRSLILPMLFFVQKLGAKLSREERSLPERGCSDGPFLR
jgi:hypothetical protein